MWCGVYYIHMYVYVHMKTLQNRKRKKKKKKKKLKKTNKQKNKLPDCSCDSFLDIDSWLSRPITFCEQVGSDFLKYEIETTPIETHSSPEVLMIPFH